MTRLCTFCNTNTECFIKPVRLCCNKFEIVLQCVRDCVRLQKRVSFMCAALRTRAGEDVSCTKAPKHWQTVHQCTKRSAAGQRSPEQGSAERVLSSQESSPPFLFLPSSSILLGAVLVCSIFENQKSTSAPSPLGTFSLSQPAQPELLRAFSFSFFLTLAALEGRILIEIRKIGEA